LITTLKPIVDFYHFNIICILKDFVDVDDFFLCLQNGGNSPQKTFNYIINIYFKHLKTVDKVYDDFKN
jgi:hypothetical protein